MLVYCREIAVEFGMRWMGVLIKGKSVYFDDELKSLVLTV
jgi:hypothetical protein